MAVQMGSDKKISNKQQSFEMEENRVGPHTAVETNIMKKKHNARVESLQPNSTIILGRRKCKQKAF